MTTIKLYDDQAEFVDKLRDSLKHGNRRILGVASPAFGKTVVAAYITAQARARDPGASVWFLVHRKNLLRQTSASFWRAKIEHGLITSGRRRSRMPIQVGTIQTVFSRLDSLSPPKILFIDEAHLSRGNMFETVARWAVDSGAILIGLTGTPIRLDGKPLGGLFSDLIEAKSTRWLIEQGRLSDYIYLAPSRPVLDGVKKAGGDYDKDQLSEVMDKPAIVGDAVTHWRKHANGMRTVCYCINVAHSKHTADAFNAAGIPAVHVDGDSTEAEIKDACEGLADRRYLVLCNCELVIEGFDLSAQVGRDVTLEACILLRPTKSLARYLQMVFRALRMKPHKAVILDHAGCAMEHGLPCDEREWSLDGAAKGKRGKSTAEEDVKVQQCTSCYGVFRPPVDVCPYCGEPVERKERKIETVDGTLEVIDVEAMRRTRAREQGSSRTIRDLVALGMRRGMRKPAQWAAITFSARLGRKPSREEYDAAFKAQAELSGGRNNERRDSDPAENDGCVI